MKVSGFILQNACLETVKMIINEEMYIILAVNSRNHSKKKSTEFDDL